MSKLEGKVAIITGGASGIGEAAVRRFLAEGASVVIADLQEQKGQELAASLGDSVLFHRTDVTSEPDVQKLIEATIQRFGQLDVFYNNAGFGCAQRSIIETPIEEFDIQLAVLLRGTFLGIKHAAAVMKPRRAAITSSTGIRVLLSGSIGFSAPMGGA